MKTAHEAYTANLIKALDHNIERQAAIRSMLAHAAAVVMAVDDDASLDAFVASTWLCDLHDYHTRQIRQYSDLIAKCL